MVDTVQAYLELVKERPDLFVPSEKIPLILEEAKIRAFSAENRRPMGMVCDNRPYFMVLADLCGTDHPYSYVRVVYPRRDSNGAAALPCWQGKFGFLRIFRHAPRQDCLEIPRGFSDAGQTPEENIRRELAEEMGAVLSGVQYLGSVRADSGLSAGLVQIFLAEVQTATPQIGHEGIHNLIWLTKPELKQAIAEGQITDGFTLSALSLYRSRYSC